MKVLVKSQEDNIRVWIPNLLINPRILRFILKKANVAVDDNLKRVLPKLCLTLKKFRRHHKRFVLVEVITLKKEHIKITL
jgi:hypothetical protein